MLNCEEVLNQLSEYLDEEARAELCRAIEAHLKRCRGCKVEVDTLKKTIMIYREPEVPMPPIVGAALEGVMAREYQRRRSEPPKD